MPAGVAPRLGVQDLSPIDAPLSERLRLRGPEYLRWHLDAARPARRSAVERLAADRAKYVKSPRGPGSGESCSGESPAGARGPGGEQRQAAGAAPSPPGAGAGAPGPVPRRPIARRPLRPDSLVIYRQKCELGKGTGGDSLRAGLVKKLFQGPGKDRALLAPQMPKGREEEVKTEGPDARAKGEDVVVPKVAGSNPDPGAVAGSVPPAEAPDRSLSGGTPRGCQPAPPGSELREVRRRGLHRSQSDVSSRYSKSFAEGLDTFFQYCGLDPEVVEALGRENFASGSDHLAFKVRSVSIATSDSGFSRHSGGDDGLQEEELIEQAPTTTSVVEKNARIIKWLYTCKKAKEAPSKRQ
ncbi:protein FAM110C [Tenrec ecaudatus]|uniref:protein FAM110C n=1 Tax=Tenrec ecaudatus TaxID=94439 RepID=UPI003F59579F